MRILLAVWLLFVTGLSLAPFGVKRYIRANTTVHDWGHVAIFFLTIVLVLWNANGTASKVWRSIAVICFAILLEFLEKISSQIPLEWSDVFHDGIGVVAGVLVVSLATVFSRHLSDERS